MYVSTHSFTLMSKFTQNNKEFQSRIPIYSTDQRFDYETTSYNSLHFNQHTKLPFEMLMNHDYRRLIQQSNVESKSSSYSLFECWTLKPSFGLYENTSGYMRFNHNGEKVLCHVFTFCYHNPGSTITHRISHLCKVKACCRPSHLIDEDMSTNIQRSYCPGYVMLHDAIYRVCKHIPSCLPITKIDKASRVLSIPRSQNLDKPKTIK